MAGEVPYHLLMLQSWSLLRDVVCSMPVFLALWSHAQVRWVVFPLYLQRPAHTLSQRVPVTMKEIAQLDFKTQC